MIKEHAGFTAIMNGERVRISEISALDFKDFADTLVSCTKTGLRVSALFGATTDQATITALYAVLADDEQNRLFVGRTEIQGTEFPSITPRCPQVHLFEREIAEQFGLKPVGHPWFRPVRFTRSWTAKPIVPGVADFYRVEGAQVHEVSVGPVHAGVIEPGHFLFQCHGEKVFQLEIALGYQHRGVEKAMEGAPGAKSIHYMETAAGDTTIGHATSYCQIVESLAHTQVPARAQVLRGIALELERIANHVGDLGALAGDVGFLPTASFCGRLRGDYLNLTAALCGNRFGRALVCPGGVTFDPDQTEINDILARLKILKKETAEAINLLWDNQSVMSRFEDTGRLPKEQAIDLGIVGPAARASGLLRDARYSQPSGIFRFAQIPVSAYDSCDVFARAQVRWLEIQQSTDFIANQLATIPSGKTLAPISSLKGGNLCVAINEGWRGEICHVAITDEQGAFSRYKIVDPSFHNWHALACALAGQEISDFPICNKSFNLSYCGHDL